MLQDVEIPPPQNKKKNQVKLTNANKQINTEFKVELKQKAEWNLLLHI